MEKKPIRFEDAPWGYALCFNADCPKKQECIHYLIGTMVPPERKSGMAIYPSAWKDGECKCFKPCQQTSMAWGFNSLYKNVPSYLRAEARRRVRSYFGSGVSAYYRYHHGERYLVPKQQKDILSIVGQYGSLDGVGFDHYELCYDFT